MKKIFNILIIVLLLNLSILNETNAQELSCNFINLENQIDSNIQIDENRPKPNQTININSSIKNNSSHTAINSKLILEIYKTRPDFEESIKYGDTLIEEIILDRNVDIKPGQELSYSNEWTVPANIPTGEYYLDINLITRSSNDILETENKIFRDQERFVIDNKTEQQEYISIDKDSIIIHSESVPYNLRKDYITYFEDNISDFYINPIALEFETREEYIEYLETENIQPDPNEPEIVPGREVIRFNLENNTNEDKRVMINFKLFPILEYNVFSESINQSYTIPAGESVPVEYRTTEQTANTRVKIELIDNNFKQIEEYVLSNFNNNNINIDYVGINNEQIIKGEETNLLFCGSYEIPNQIDSIRATIEDLDGNIIYENQSNITNREIDFSDSFMSNKNYNDFVVKYELLKNGEIVGGKSVFYSCNSENENCVTENDHSLLVYLSSILIFIILLIGLVFINKKANLKTEEK